MEKLKNLIQSNIASFLLIGKLDLEKLQTSLNLKPTDWQLLEAETIKIENIRNLSHWLGLKPFDDKPKLAIISNAESMTEQAANALLKTLEEPPSYAKIILTTSDENKILLTIRSRCLKYILIDKTDLELPELYLSPQDLKTKTIKEKFDWAAKIAELEKRQIKDILTAWQIYYRQTLLEDSDVTGILKQIQQAKDLLETNISLKLLLENLLLEI